MCWKRAFCDGRQYLTIACGVLLWGEFAFAQPATPALNHFASGGEVVGRPPELFSFLRDNLFAVVDPLDASIVVVGRNGQIAGRSNPLPFFPVAVRETAVRLEFEEAGGARRAVLARNVNTAQIGTLPIEAVTLQPAAAPALRLARANARTLRIDRPRAPALTVRSLAGGYLSDAKLLGRDATGRWYVQSSEIVMASPTIKTLVFVQRFSPAGTLEDVATVPVADMDTVPSNIVALTPAGIVTAIVPTDTGVFLQLLTFRSTANINRIQPAAAPARTPISTTVHQSSQGQTPIDDRSTPQPAAVIPPATRAQIIGRADAFLRHQLDNDAK